MLASLYGMKYARRNSALSKSQLHYWRAKFESGSTSSRGGARNWKYTLGAHRLVEGMLWRLVEDNHIETPDIYAEQLRQLGILDVTTSWVIRTLARWNYTRKKIYYVQQNKFTVVNTLRYIDHVLGMPMYNPTKVKFMDESRFETRRVRRHHGYSRRGHPIVAVAGDNHRESFSFSLVLD